jgi:hypothetical protein
VLIQRNEFSVVWLTIPTKPGQNRPLIEPFGSSKQLARCSRENSMSRFVTHFMKKVIGDNGHEQEICQRIVEVNAASRAEAAELAKQKFCETEQVCNWSHHADRLLVEEADFPS